MKYLIVGLGNIGTEYEGTRHNIGFDIVDRIAKDSNERFNEDRYGLICKMRVKNKSLVLLKPTTFMNLSGNAVRYWMQKENISLENILICVDDLSIPFGTIRIRPGGSEAGHNGLKSITQQLNTQQYSRLRFGIGNNFQKGGQVDFVLGKFTVEELQNMDDRLRFATEAVKSFTLSGLSFTMTNFNKK